MPGPGQTGSPDGLCELSSCLDVFIISQMAMLPRPPDRTAPAGERPVESRCKRGRFAARMTRMDPLVAGSGPCGGRLCDNRGDYRGTFRGHHALFELCRPHCRASGLTPLRDPSLLPQQPHQHVAGMILAAEEDGEDADGLARFVQGEPVDDALDGDAARAGQDGVAAGAAVGRGGDGVARETRGRMTHFRWARIKRLWVLHIPSWEY